MSTNKNFALSKIFAAPPKLPPGGYVVNKKAIKP